MMIKMTLGECRGCGETILWLTRKGKRHPLNKKPKLVFIDKQDEDGNFLWGYESHFSTCPHADKFRNKKGGNDANTNEQK